MAETFVNFQSSFNNKSGTDMGGLNAYGKKNIVSGSKEFLMSNTLVAKISFLLLVLICFSISIKQRAKEDIAEADDAIPLLCRKVL